MSATPTEAAMRFCIKCGAAYPKHDTILRCEAEVDGRRCQGEVLNPPVDPNREQLGPADCLICLDSGFVVVLGETRACSRPGCANRRPEP